MVKSTASTEFADRSIDALQLLREILALQGIEILTISSISPYYDPRRQPVPLAPMDGVAVQITVAVGPTRQ